jgi:GT2 family glycosyltransferase
LISNPRRLGLVANWNNCVAQARGEWIKFVFQDDVVHPTCIESLLKACQQHGKVFGFCEREFIFENGTPQYLRDFLVEHEQRLHCEYQKSPVITQAQAIRTAARGPYYNMVGEPTVTLIKRSVFEEIGGFDEALIQLCDAEFWARTAITYGAAHVPEKLAAFRVHARAATARNLDTREFCAQVLDPLVLRYQFAFRRKFARLRDRSITGMSNLRWRLDCAYFAFDAWKRAKGYVLAGSASSDGPMAEWRRAASYCPGLPILVWIGHLQSFVRRLKPKILKKNNAAR